MFIKKKITVVLSVFFVHNGIEFRNLSLFVNLRHVYKSAIL